MRRLLENTRVSRLSTAFCVLLATAQGSIASADGNTLCIGADGHVKIEASVDGQCAEYAADQSAVPAHGPAAFVADASNTGHCGECVDIALDSQCPAIEIRDAGTRDQIPPPAPAHTGVTAAGSRALRGPGLLSERGPAPHPIYALVASYLI